MKLAVAARGSADLWVLTVLTVGAFCTFAIINPVWVNRNLVQTMVSQSAALALVAVPLTFSIISRNIDLSVGSVLALQGMVLGRVSESSSLTTAVLAAIGVGVVIGLFHGFLVAKLGLSAIMATLATFIWARGLTLAINDSRPIPVEGWLVEVANERWAGFTIAAPLVVIAYVVGQWLRSRTKVGLYTAAIGGGPDAARRSGIAIDRYVVGLFVATGVVVGVAAALTVGQLGSASPYIGTELGARRDHRRGHRWHEPGRWLRVGEPDGGGRDVHERAQQRPAQPRAHRRLLPISSRTRVDRRLVVADPHASPRRASSRTQRCLHTPRSGQRMKLDGLDNKVAFVTGAAQGIGRQICLMLVDQGCRVIGADVAPVELDDVTPLALDVADEVGIDSAVTQVENDVGGIDLLVLNAGVISKASLADTTTAEWDRHLKVNLTGPFLLSRRVVPGMAARGFGRRRAHRVERRDHGCRRRAHRPCRGTPRRRPGRWRSSSRSPLSTPGPA